MTMKLVDMALTPREQAEDMNNSMPMVAGNPDSNMPKYPYGLCISLDQDSLEKLGVDHSDWSVGDIFDLRAMTRVTSVSEHETESGMCCRVELQIIMMGCESEDDEDSED